MNEVLLEALRDGDPWLERFDKRRYGDAFQEYTERFGPLYREAVRETGAEILAGELVEALRAGRRRRFWGRAAQAFAEKQMMVVYLAPMLREIGEEAFGELLREAWARQWPRDAYEISSREEIQGGFRDTLFGIEWKRR